MNLLQSPIPHTRFEMRNLGAEAFPLLGSAARTVLEVLLCLDSHLPIDLLKALSTHLVYQTAYELLETLVGHSQAGSYCFFKG
jgi:hypothetical protein